MKKLMVTSIEFVYADGEDKLFTGAYLHFRSIGTDFTLEGRVEVNRNEYNMNSSSVDDLSKLALSKVVYELGGTLAE